MTNEKLNDLAKRSNAIIDKYLAMEQEITCIGCKKTPEKISEYVSAARVEDITPTEFVKQNEPIGCWGPHSRNKFYCTKCYIKAGMPLRR
jgi:hypothetical protein